MKFLCWNGRGQIRPHAKRALHQFVQKHNPSVIKLMETQANVNAFNNFSNFINYPNRFSIPTADLTGGFLLCWYLDLELQVKYVWSCFVVVEILCPLGKANSYFVRFVYIPSYYKLKHKICDEIINLLLCKNHGS